MCYGCYRSSDSGYHGEIHLIELEKDGEREYCFATGGGPKEYKTYCEGITKPFRFAVPEGMLRSFASEHNLTNYSITEYEARWIARALFNSDFESVKQTFDLEALH